MYTSIPHYCHETQVSARPKTHIYYQSPHKPVVHRHLLQEEEFYILPSPYLVEGTGVRDQNTILLNIILVYIHNHTLFPSLNSVFLALHFETPMIRL